VVVPSVAIEPRRAERVAGYERHRPEETLLWRLAHEHWQDFLQEAGDAGTTLPRYVLDEFDGYLSCGLLEHGVARLGCEGCGHELLVAFSCKARGFCPSCGGRRMTATAARLADHVFPAVPVRQWVLSAPFELRLLLARNPEVLTALSTRSAMTTRRTPSAQPGGCSCRWPGASSRS
jgi:hypothetical protein